MESPDVVDTSDVEERDILSFSDDVNRWDSAASTPRKSANAAMSSRDVGIVPGPGLQSSPGSLLVLTARRYSDHEVENPSPRKRVKIAHDAGLFLPGCASMIAEVSLSNDKCLELAVTEQIPCSPQKYSERCMPADENKQSASQDVSPPSEYDSLFSSQDQLQSDSFDIINQLWPQNIASRSTSKPPSRSLSRSLSVSTNHNSIFSSPHRPTTPPQTSSQHSHSQSSSARRKPHLVASSPLTPISSPARLLPTLSQSPDPIQLPSPRHPRAPHSLVSRSTHPPALLPTDRSPSVEIPNDLQPLGRYALRRREARQLNPYAYDKLLYKQQLKFHPDAIVKFRSPRRAGHGVVGEDGTQDGFPFSLDNPDEDGDYLDVGAESSGRRGYRVQSLDRNNEVVEIGQEPGSSRMGDDWLPEALKDLSSSDDDDNEFRKLARKIRKEREKARIEARKIASEAHRAEIQTRKPTKRRPKPFPVCGDIDIEEAARQTSSAEHTLSLSRMRSEPATAQGPSSPELPFEISASPRVPSPTPGSELLRSPGWGTYLQQEKSYPLDDDGHGPRLPQNRSPVDPTVYSMPSSPSAPPPTSGASALPSNTSGVDSESDQSSAFEMSSKDRKRLRALRRMMPAAMVARHLGRNAVHPQPVRTVTAESSGSEAEEALLIPGIARIRKGKYNDMEVRGDPESSDVEHPAQAHDNNGEEDSGLCAMEILSDRDPVVKVKRARHTSPSLKDENNVISLSDDSIPGSSSEGSESSGSDDDRQALFDHPVGGPARERSLIDWMLSRTRDSSGVKSKSRSKQPMGRRKSRGSGAPRLNIVTNSAKRYGQHHQTLLPFVRTNSSSDRTSPINHYSGLRDQAVQLDQDTVEERKKRKKKWRRRSRTNQGLSYNVHHDAIRITSKHHEAEAGRGRTTLVLEHDDNDFRQALDPGWRVEVERWNRPVSLAHQLTANQAISTPLAPRRRIHRRTSPQPQQEIPLPFYFQREEDPFPSSHRRIVIDLNITPLPSGVKFGASSYIGKGLLHQLTSVTSGSSEVAQPIFCNVQGVEIGPTTSAPVFSALLGPLCDRLVSALGDFEANDVNTIKEWEFVIRAANRLLSWLAVHAEDQEFGAMEVVLRESLNGLLLSLGSLETSIFTLTTHWFIVELFARFATGVKYRRGSVENGHLMQSAKQLMQRLLDIDLQPAIATFRAAEADVDDVSLPHRAAELWVCLIHLLPNFATTPQAVPGHPFWRLLADLYPDSSPTGAEASEDMWRTIFTLCAISQFSPYGLSTSTFRLPAAWELVAAALKKIALTADPEKERRLPQRALKKRDDYVSCVVSRCFLLWNQWEWRLDDGIVMFKSLHEIFRSRNFANLLNERSVPMGFLENGDLELLSKRDPHDCVFEVFLKMVVQAVHLLNANAELDPKQRSVNIKKLLQMAVPVSPLPFSLATPPSMHSLSMLVNRFSAMAVAVHLDPTSSNVKFRVSQARRCVSFRDADDQSRIACVYGMMNFAMIVRHHKTAGGLEEVLGWLGEMTDILVEEYKEGETGSIKKKRATTLTQLLIGSVRRVVETQSLVKEQNRSEYPDPLLLDGPWVTRVFNPRTDLVTIQQTGFEIRMLVQSFLDARHRAMPDVQPPPLPVVHSAESQESQDEYDKLFLDLNDEELLAALGDEAETSTIADLKSKEDAVCKVLDKSIAPAVYRLVCKHFGENESTRNDTLSARAADEWIDCWVGCANVLVQNNYKDWGLYMKLGQQSWEKIIDESWRRRVGLRFNLTLLRLDPGAYSKMKDEFIAVLLVALLSCKTTIEHEFMSVVLSLDGLRHPLLCGAPLDPMPETRKYEVCQRDYETVRGRLIETILANTAGCLRARLDAESQAYAELVVMMLSTMRDIYQELTEAKEEYGEICRRVFHTLLSHPELSTHPRMSDALAWGRREWGVG